MRARHAGQPWHARAGRSWCGHVEAARRLAGSALLGALLPRNDARPLLSLRTLGSLSSLTLHRPATPISCAEMLKKRNEANKNIQ